MLLGYNESDHVPVAHLLKHPETLTRSDDSGTRLSQKTQAKVDQLRSKRQVDRIDSGSLNVSEHRQVV